MFTGRLFQREGPMQDSSQCYADLWQEGTCRSPWAAASDPNVNQPTQTTCVCMLGEGVADPGAGS